MGYIVGVDIGGTLTDCLALKTSDDGTPPAASGKSSSTPPEYRTGHVQVRAEVATVDASVAAAKVFA